MSHSPLDQFLVRKIVNIECFGYDISITNSSVFMILSVALILLYFTVVLARKQLVPGRLQISGEMLYEMIYEMLEDNVGHKGRKFVPLVFSLFMFILVCNLLGMIPYGFTVTSHISITFTIAIVMFIFITLLGLYLHGLRFFSLFLPEGIPLLLVPLIFIIELFAYLVRPVSLSIRLSANMVAGHVLLKVVAGFVISVAIYLKLLPVPFMVILIGFEIFVAILQAYIFTILSCIYINDIMNLH